MTIEEHLTRFAGLPVQEYPVRRAQAERLREPESWAWRLNANIAWDDHDPYATDDFAARFAAFVGEVDTTRVSALIIGATDKYEFDAAVAVRLLAEHAAAFPGLRALFFADLVREESDVAYIDYGDLMPILEGYPALEELHVRGSTHGTRPEELAIRPFRSSALRTLVFESGGLNPGIIRAIGASDIPELEHVEFYFGDEDYGGGAEVADIAWLLDGEKLPKLRYLGLRDAPNADEFAAAVAHAPIAARIEELDLSLGALSDVGAAALLAGQPLTHLRRLDLHHHFLSDGMMQRLREALPGVELDLGEQLETEEWDGESYRYIAVSE